MPPPLTEGIFRKWLALVQSTFSTRDAWEEIGIASAEGKAALRTILWRFEQKGEVVSLGRGIFRKVNITLDKVDWQKANPDKVVPLVFPFGEHEYCRIYPKSIIIVAGSKNVGKTAYLYNFIKLNMNKFPIDLYNSETSPEQMNERFRPLLIPEPAPFDVYERYDNFADVIKPEKVSVIDYLDVGSETYLVGAEIDAIFRKLKGVAVIGLQKPAPATIYTKTGQKKVIERDLAYGAAFSAKRAVLYITMSVNKLKLLYVKTPKQKNVNPDNMTFTFKLAGDGITFTNIQRSYEADPF